MPLATAYGPGPVSDCRDQSRHTDCSGSSRFAQRTGYHSDLKCMTCEKKSEGRAARNVEVSDLVIQVAEYSTCGAKYDISNFRVPGACAAQAPCLRSASDLRIVEQCVQERGRRCAGWVTLLFVGVRTTRITRSCCPIVLMLLAEVSGELKLCDLVLYYPPRLLGRSAPRQKSDFLTS